MRHLAYRSVFVTAYLYDDEGIVRLAEDQAHPFVSVIEAFREHVRACINSRVSGPSGEILKALTLGDKTGISCEIRDRFARLGIAHLLAISGLHIGIISFLTYSLANFLLRLYYPLLLHINVRSIAAVLSVIPAVLYCCIAGMQLPTIRACITVSYTHLTLPTN